MNQKPEDLHVRAFPKVPKVHSQHDVCRVLGVSNIFCVLPRRLFYI